jgi:hypothetical protein
VDGLTVTELHTQDGWDWPNGVSDERWPVGEKQQAPATAQQILDEWAAQAARWRAYPVL